MTPPRLILVEGLPGSGKSTTAQQVWLRLEGLGAPARWWFEHELGHPIFNDEEVRAARAGGPAGAPGLFERALAGWRALAARLRADGGTVILESTLFQTAVGTQLLMDAPPAEIAAHFERTAAIIAPLAPELIRLQPPDAVAALRRTCARRHPWFAEFLLQQFAGTARRRRLAAGDMAAVESYFAERQAVASALAERFPGPQLVHDNSDGDWARQRRAVAEFLGLPPEEPAPPPPGLDEWVGRYRSAAGDSWQVAADDRGIYLADEAGTRLLPHGRDAFVVEGLCLELAFERSAAGAVRAIRCRGALPDLAPHWIRV